MKSIVNNKQAALAVVAGSMMASNALAITTCKDDTTDYSNIWGVLQRDLQYLPNNKNFVIQSISGNITIVDNCTFKVSNFTLYPAPDSTQWYGTNADGSKSYHISRNSVNAQYNPAEYTFTLNSDVNAGETPRWSDIQVITLFGETNKVVIAHANINTDGSVKGENNTSGGSANTTASDSGSTSGSPSSGSMNLKVLGSVATLAISGLVSIFAL